MTVQASIIAGLPTPRTGTFRYLDLARRIKTETQGQKLMILYYASRALANGSFSVGLDTITAETGLSRATVGRANADFKWAGILDWDKGFGNRHGTVEGKPNTYQFNLQKFQQLLPIVISCRQPTLKEQTARVQVTTALHKSSSRNGPHSRD